jgi:hypothetical protein
MPETEHSGVYVEEAAGQPKPIDGVPTRGDDLFASMTGARFRHGVAIGGAVLAGLGILLASARGNVLQQLLDTSWGVQLFVALFVAALALGMLRRLVERRRRIAGRALLPVGMVAFGLISFMLATLVAVTICLIALAGSALVAPDVTVMLTATTNVLIGCVMVQFALTSLRDILLLIAAVRDNSPSSSPRA